MQLICLNRIMRQLINLIVIANWIKSRGEEIKWDEVNLFTNDFVDTFGEITLNKDNLP